MKKRWVRETLCLLLPVLLIGGGVLLKKGDLLKWSNPLDPGDKRMEIVGIKPLELTPLDVANGYDWGTTIATRTLGDDHLPKNWKPSWFSTSPNVRFVYRVGKVWKPFPQTKGESYLGVFVGTDEYSFRVDLKSIPKDVDEVRMRGNLGFTQYFTGPLPTGWKPPKNVTVRGARCELHVETNPIDIVIKAPGEAMPVPQVSQEKKIKLIDACWFTTKYTNGISNDFFLHLRHSEKRNWSSDGAHAIDKLQFFDADGNKLVLYQNNGKGTRSLGSYVMQNQEMFSPDKLDSDLIVSLVLSDEAPRKPWSSYKQPIRVEAEISDGTCWPTKIKATFRQVMGRDEGFKKFGAPLP